MTELSIEQHLERLKAAFPGALAPYPALCDAILVALRDARRAERERCARVVTNYGFGINPTGLRDMIAGVIRQLPDDDFG